MGLTAGGRRLEGGPPGWQALAMQPFSRADLEAQGFQGFTDFATLDLTGLPARPGVYALLRPERSEPKFLARNPSGKWKGKDPTVSLERLSKKWLPDADCVYLGKAQSLMSRIALMRAFAVGQPVMHWGGRLLWQAETTYLFSYMETPTEDPRTVEKRLLREFSDHYGALPFANLRH